MTTTELKIKSIPRPDDQSDEYQFFREEGSGNIFKVKASVQPTNSEQSLGDTPIAHTQFGLVVNTSMVDENFKAKRLDDLPVVDSYSFTVTEEVLKEEGFDPMEKLKAMVIERITYLQQNWAMRANVENLGDLWKGKPIQL